MANDKDFVVNGPVAVGKDTKVTVGSITSGDIDLSTGNYFDDTLAANTTYTISNAGGVQAFQLEVTGGSVDGVVNSTYATKLLDYGSQTIYARGIAWKEDGSRIYIVSGSTASTRKVYQYNLSTNWDVSTASYSNSDDISGQSTSAEGVAFKTDGTVMYVIDRDNDTVFQYTLSTAWTVSTAVYANKSFSVGSRETQPTGVRFSSDGTKMFVIGYAGNDINEFTLSTAWDVSTASYDSVFSIASQTTDPRGFDFNSNGTFMVVADNDTIPTVYSYSLSTAWDVSTATFIDSFDVSSNVNSGDFQDIAIDSSSTKFYVMDNNSDQVHQYSALGAGATVTWPSSIEWTAGSAPSAPANGETDVYTFTTDDGGTTYTGIQSIDNAS
jgi:hypothetical protein